jgi:hypothetical protein
MLLPPHVLICYITRCGVYHISAIIGDTMPSSLLFFLSRLVTAPGRAGAGAISLQISLEAIVGAEHFHGATQLTSSLTKNQLSCFELTCVKKLNIESISHFMLFPALLSCLPACFPALASLPLLPCLPACLQV